MSLQGVIGAGGILGRYEASSDLLGGQKIGIISVTPGFVGAAWYVQPDTPPGSISPIDLSTRYGLTEGTTLTVDGKPVNIEWRPEVSSRIDGTNDALVLVTPPRGAVSSCYVSFTPDTRSIAASALEGWFGERYNVDPFLLPSELVRNPDIAFSTRVSQWVALAAAAMAAAFQLALWYGRRAEFGLYSVLGLRQRDLVFLLFAEAVTTCIVPFQAGALVALGLVLTSQTALPTLVLQAIAIDIARGLLLLLVMPAVGWISLLRRTALDRLKGA